jgi:Big-like domain-containing protein
MGQTDKIKTVVESVKLTTDPAFVDLGLVENPFDTPNDETVGLRDYRQTVYLNDPATGRGPMTRPAPIDQTLSTVLASAAATVTGNLSASIAVGSLDRASYEIVSSTNCTPTLNSFDKSIFALNPDAAFVAAIPAGQTQNASFKWRLKNGRGAYPATIDNGTVTIPIQGEGAVTVNQPPVAALAIPDFALQEDITGGRTTGSMTFAAGTFTDPDGDTLTYSAVENGLSTLPTGVTFDAVNRRFDFDFDGNFFGSFVIVVTADDGNGGTDSTTFTLTVNEANDPPQSSAPLLSMTEATTSLSVDWITGFVTDVESDTPYTITAAVFRAGASVGSISIQTGGALIDVTLNAGQVGDFFVDYTIEDARLGSRNVTARVTGIAATGPTPLSIADTSTTTAEDSGDVVVDFSASITAGSAALDPTSVFIMDDWDANVFAGRVVTIPGVATITASLTEHKFTIARVLNFDGDVVFRYRESDVNGLPGNWSTHTDTGVAVNDPPVILTGQTFTVNEGASIVLDLSQWVTDVDIGDTLSVVSTSTTNGAVDQVGLTWPFIRYNAHADSTANDPVVFDVTDGTVTVQGTATAVITPVDDDPRVDTLNSVNSISIIQGASTDRSVALSDPDANASIIPTILSQPAIGGGITGSIIANGNGSFNYNFTYTAPSGAVGADDFTLRFTDDTGRFVDHTVTSTVSAPPPPPPASLPVYPGEIPTMVKDFITMAMNPLFVTSAAGVGNVATDFSTGSLPILTDQVVVTSGGKLTIPSGVTVTCDFMRIDGELDIQSGGTLECDTLMIMPAGKLTVRGVNASQSTIRIRTASDIDVVRDPNLISRGVINMGVCDILGAVRIRQLPITIALTAGVSTQVTLGTQIFLGAPGAPAGDGEDDMLIDWAATDKLVIGANKAKGLEQTIGAIGELNEICEIQSIAIVNATSPFQVNDPAGTVVTLTQPVVNDHQEYDDAAELAIVQALGPPASLRPGSSASSHANWLGKPHIHNVSRYIKFTVTDTAAPVHRRPTFFANNPDTQMKWAEFTDWGRTDLTRSPVDPGSQVNTAMTNLKHRGPIVLYKCGFRTAVDSVSPVATVEGCSIWGGPIGDTFANNTRGAGSMGFGIEQYRCTAIIKRNVTHNTVGSGLMDSSRINTGEWSRNQIIEVWGRNLGDRDGLPKDGSLVAANDLGVFASGMFQTSRMVRNIQNMIYGCEHAGLIVMPRGEEAEEDSIIDPQYSPVPYEQHGWQQFSSDFQKAALEVEGMYVAGCGLEFYTTKTNIRQIHQYPTILKNCVNINCKGGIELEYVDNYIIINYAHLGLDPTGLSSNFMLGTAASAAQIGILLGLETAAVTVVKPYMAHVATGIKATKTFVGTQRSDVQHNIVNPTFGAGVTTDLDNLSAPDDVKTIAEPFDLTFGVTLDAFSDAIFSNPFTKVRGSMQDGIGTAGYPYGQTFDPTGAILGEDIDMNSKRHNGVMYKDGYWTDTVSGDTYIKVPVTCFSRLDGSTRTVLTPWKTPRVPPDPFNNPWFDPPGGTLIKAVVDNGSGDYAADLSAATAALAVQ